jgi:hypothetical protein
MENSFANDGRLGVARPKSNLENVAWLGTTCAGRSHVTNFTRAMNAHTDLVTCPAIEVSLWKLQRLKSVVAQLDCRTH